jgi:hypothetical protein
MRRQGLLRESGEEGPEDEAPRSEDGETAEDGREQERTSRGTVSRNGLMRLSIEPMSHLDGRVAFGPLAKKDR